MNDLGADVCRGGRKMLLRCTGISYRTSRVCVKCPKCGFEWALEPRALPFSAFPVSVRCYGRSYVAKDKVELDELIALLTDNRKAKANRFRVGFGRYAEDTE